MKNLARWLTVISLLALLLTLAGCNNDSDQEVIIETPQVIELGEQAVVPGATPGSSNSNFVANREIWTEIAGMEDMTAETSEIHVPVILLESDGAEAANAEIEEIIQDIINTSEEEPEYFELNVRSSFSVFQNNEILSVSLTYSNFFIERAPTLRTFNFRLSDGKRLNDAAMAKLYGIESVLLGAMEESIARKYAIFDAYDLVYKQLDPENHIPFIFPEGQTLEDLWYDFNPNGNRLFINEAGELSFNVLAGEYYDWVLPIEMQLPYQDKRLTPAFVKMCRDLGLDPNDDAIDGLIVYLGGMYDAESVEMTLRRLAPLINLYNNDDDPQMLLRRMHYSDDDYHGALAGEETYLFVPKWKYSSIGLNTLALDEQAKLVVVPNDFNDREKATGPVLICINQSDIYQDAEICVRYRDEEIIFTPYISSMDGSVVIPDNIYNAEELLDSKIDFGLSYNLYRDIMMYLPWEEK